MILDKFLKIFTLSAITLFSLFPILSSASYTPQDGRISYLVGAMINTNFQENLFNNSDNPTKLGRSQSFALLVQALGDISPRGSLMAEVHLGHHKFIKQTDYVVDEYKFEAISFDLGYRRKIAGNFWWSAQIGSMYPWRVSQKIQSQSTNYDESEFSALYSAVLGIQYESKVNGHPVSYDFRIRKYMSSQIDDQATIGLGIGWRFNAD